MNERVSADVQIKRLSSGAVSTVATVPITVEAKRRFYLMKEDYVKLMFNLETPVTFKIGDYIEDELFGTFYITEKQFPTFNEASGCYKYELQFDSHYMRWKNRLAMLTTTASGSRIRKETNWKLTDVLSAHAQEICYNLSVLGFQYNGTPYTYSIDFETASHAKEALLISYDGVDIIEALNAIAKAFKCEWFVIGSVIYFGKCEIGEEFVFSLNPWDGNEANMVAVTPQRNDALYANHLYIFGGTQNIPETYGKKLVFTVTDLTSTGGRNYYTDANRKVTPDMFVIPGLSSIQSVSSTPSYDIDNTKASFSGSTFTIPRGGTYALESIRVGVKFTLTNHGMVRPGQNLSAHWTATLYLVDGVTSQKTAITENEGSAPYDTMQAVVSTRVEAVLFNTKLKQSLVANRNYSLLIEVTSDYYDDTISDVILSGTDVLMISPDAVFVNATLTFNDTNYGVRFNPNSQTAQEDLYSKFCFVNASGNYRSAPSGFGVGSQYTLSFSDSSTEGLDVTKVPVSFWSSDYSDPSSIMKVGEMRLHLPTISYPDGYIATSEAEDNDDIVERVVLFENVFPQCILKVSGITETERKESTENSDMSKTYWNWIQYGLTATRKNGASFPFKQNFILPGVTLQARFLTPEEAGLTASGEGYKLAGMTFDVSFSVVNGSPTYTLVRNETYGAKLPNDVLCPTVGDPFVLLGWNVSALSSLGLVDEAEVELRTIGREYANAMEEDQFIFRCRMFSTSMKALASMPDFGRKIRIKYALTGDKVSRVLGYTFNLGKPWNTPEYEVGETDAYSRRRQLEEEMQRTGVSVSSTTVETMSGTQSGGSNVDLTGYLTVDEAMQLFEKKGSAIVSWNNLQDKPDTVSGFGITDVYTKTQTDAKIAESTFFEKYTDDNGQTYSIRLKQEFTGLWADGFMSAGGINSSGGGGGGGGTLSRVAAQGAGGISVSGSPITSNSGQLTIGIDNSHKLPTVTEWNGKQDVISDLATIRQNAALGATALQQESDPVFSASAAATISQADIAAWYAKGNVTGIKMNGSIVGTTGIVDLGTVITQHQSLAGYQTLLSLNNRLNASFITPDSTHRWWTDALQTTLDGKATDSAVVHKTGTETIDGYKTFSGTVYFGSVDPECVLVNNWDSIGSFDDGESLADALNSKVDVLVLDDYLEKSDFRFDILCKSPLYDSDDLNTVFDKTRSDYTGVFSYYACVGRNASTGTAGTNGFPAAHNANALLTIGTYSEATAQYLYQMGLSSNGSIYFRDGSATKSGGVWGAAFGDSHWKRLLWEDHNGDVSVNGNVVFQKGKGIWLDAARSYGTSAFIVRGAANDYSLYINAGADGNSNPATAYVEASALVVPDGHIAVNAGYQIKLNGTWRRGNPEDPDYNPADPFIGLAGGTAVYKTDLYISNQGYNIYHYANAHVFSGQYVKPYDNNQTSLGTLTDMWSGVWAKRWYPNQNDTNTFIEYVSGNPGYFRVHGSIVADGQIAAGGIISNS